MSRFGQRLRPAFALSWFMLGACRDECSEALSRAQAVVDQVDPAQASSLLHGAAAMAQAEERCRASGRHSETAQAERAFRRLSAYASRSQAQSRR
jgi:hypothetical protein